MNPQRNLDRIVSQMIVAGHPVEETHKRDHTPTHIPADTYGDWDTSYYEENLARALIGGWRSKGALIQLVQAARQDVLKTALDIIDGLEESFSSEQYAVGQPLSSFAERFTLKKVRGELLQAFKGTTE